MVWHMMVFELAVGLLLEPRRQPALELGQLGRLDLMIRPQQLI